MTKVQLCYGLARPLDESMLEHVADLHSIYGMLRVEPTPEGLTVEYDASRLSERDVEAHLRRAGIPIQLDV